MSRSQSPTTQEVTMQDTLAVPSFDEVSRLSTFDKFVGVGGIEVTVVARRDVRMDSKAELRASKEGPPTTVRAMYEGSTAREVVATSDGRMVDVKTMQGDEFERASDGDVYFEVWRHDGSGMHGWADAETRRVVQVG